MPIDKQTAADLAEQIKAGALGPYDIDGEEAAAVLEAMGIEREGVFYVGPYLGGNVMGWPTFPRLTMWEDLQEVVEWAIPLVLEAERLEPEFEG